MRTLPRLIVSDMRYGFAAVGPRLLFAFLVVVLAFFLSYAVLFMKFPEAACELSMGEGMLCLWRGMLPYVPGQGEPFQFPMAWFALLVTSAYVVADYPFRDLGGMGSRLIVACRGRWSWWLAKCAWVCAVALACWLMTAAVAAVVAAITGGTFSLTVRPGVACVLEAGRNAELSAASELLSAGGGISAAEAPGIDLGFALLVSGLMLVAILLIQTTISLLTHPVVGMLSSISILFFSAYFRFWMLPGEYLMMARTEALMRAGMQPWMGLVLAAVLIVVAVLVGGIVFNRKDIFGRESDDR